MDLPSARETSSGIGRAAVIVLLITEMVSVMTLGAGMARADVMVDPEIRAHLRAGRARVLVMLQVRETGSDEQRADAIARAQDSVLSRLPAPHASLVRRYASIPVLALEIDAAALRSLEMMTDVVASVKLDRAMRPQ